MLGDTAVAVHPDDPTLAGAGRQARDPAAGRPAIPIVADDYADPEKGTGAVKITPAHDFNDFAVGQRHDLPMPSVLDRQARVPRRLSAPSSSMGRTTTTGSRPRRR